MLDLNNISLFVQVVRNGSFAEASRKLGIPPNNVSRRIQQLEAVLGTRLLQRTTRKLTLTSAGKTFYERCAIAVEGLLEAEQELITGSDEPNGLVRVAAPADFFDFFRMEWISEFLRRHPRVKLDFVLNDAKADLIAEQIDVAFRGGPLVDSGYVGRQLLEAGNDFMVASPAYLATHGVPSALKDLATHDCLSFARPNGFSTWSLLGPDGIKADIEVSGCFSGNTALALRKATVAGLGISLLPSNMTNIDVQAGRLVRVMPEYHRTGYGLNVLYPSRRHLPLAVSAFIDLVREKLKLLTQQPI